MDTVQYIRYITSTQEHLASMNKLVNSDHPSKITNKTSCLEPTDILSFSASPCRPTHCRGTWRCTYVIVTCLHGRELPDNKFNCRLQVLINKVGGLSLRVAACLKSRGEREVRRGKGHLYASKHMLLRHFTFITFFFY